MQELTVRVVQQSNQRQEVTILSPGENLDRFRHTLEEKERLLRDAGADTLQESTQEQFDEPGE